MTYMIDLTELNPKIKVMNKPVDYKGDAVSVDDLFKCYKCGDATSHANFVRLLRHTEFADTVYILPKLFWSHVEYYVMFMSEEDEAFMELNK